MIAERKMLTLEDLDAQSAFVLPDRETLLVTVVITNLLNNNTVTVDISNNKVAVQVCAVVELINTILVGRQSLTCTIRQ